MLQTAAGQSTADSNLAVNKKNHAKDEISQTSNIAKLDKHFYYMLGENNCIYYAVV